MNSFKLTALAAATVMALGACVAPASPPAAPAQPAEQKSTEAPQAAEAGEKIEVVFWKHDHPPANEFTKKLIEEYQAKNPNVTIKLEIVPNDQWPTKVLTAIAGKQGPDIFDANDANLPTFINRGILAPIDPQAFGASSMQDLESKFVENSLSVYKDAQGNIYGVPFEFNSWPMLINTKLFEDAGLDPANPPKTWEEVGEMGAKIAKVTDGKFERQGFAWNLLTSGWTMLLYPPIVYQLGGSVLTDDDKGDKCALNSPEGVKALQAMQDIYYKYQAGAPGINLATTANAVADLQQEKIGMWIIGPWAMPQIKEVPEVFDSIKVIPLPQAKDGKRTVVSLSTWGWVVNKDAPSDKQAEAWKFIDYASQQGPRWLTASGYILPRLGWQDSPEAKAFPDFDVWVDQMQYGRPRLQHPKSAQINAEVHKAVQQAVLNNADAQQTLDALCVEVDKILAAQ